MAKFTLDNADLAESFFDECRILGIVAPIKDYQFTWNINQRLGFEFRVNHSLEIHLRKKNRDYYFSVFEYGVPNTPLVYYLYNNQHDGEYLLPEFKHLDFLWLTQNQEVPDEVLASLSQLISSITGVQIVIELPASKIKNKQHLIL